MASAFAYWPFGLAPRSAATQEERPARRFLAASILWHALVIGIFFLPIWQAADAPLQVVATMLFEEPGSSGASGAGAGGGGENASVTAEESRPTPRIETAEHASTPPSPQSAETEATAAETAPVPPPPERKLAQIPQKPKPSPAPPKPRAKPAPPRASAPPPTPTQRPETPPQVARATPGPTHGPGMAANAPAQTGTSGNSGVGRGVEGSGQGALGEGADGPGDEYFERLRRHLRRYQEWPKNSDKERGTAVVTFTIARDGTVRSAEIERSSGYTILDQATLDMLHHASPVPPLPSTFRGDQITVSIPAEWKRGFFLKRLF